jgi:hypothetical protein
MICQKIEKNTFIPKMYWNMREKGQNYRILSPTPLTICIHWHKIIESLRWIMCLPKVSLTHHFTQEYFTL